MPLRPVTDPALLSELEAAPASAPGAAPVPSGLRPVTDPALLAALESDTAEPQPRSALAEFTRVAQPSAMERMGKEGFVPSIARPDPEVAKRLPGELASAARIGFQSGLSSIRKVIADERAWLARKAAESHAAGGYGLSPEETERAIQQDMARAGIAEMESARETRQFRRLGEQAEAITPEDAGFVERSAIDAFQSLGATALPVAAGALVPGAQVPALIALSGQAAAQRYTELTAQGIDPEEAAKSALMLGPLEGLLERAPMGTLAKKSPVVRQFFEFLVRDLAGEEVATLAELADDYRLGLADEVTVADVRQAMLDTAAQTTIAAGVQVGAVQALQSIVDRANELAQRRRPKIKEPTEEQISAGITPPTIDDEALTDEQLDAEIERLERELGGEAPEAVDTPSETTQVVEQPDVEATFSTEELKRLSGPPPAEDRVEILPSAKREGWFVVQVNGEPQAEVESREKAEELAEGLKVEVRAHEAATSPKNDLPEPTAAQIEAGQVDLTDVAPPASQSMQFKPGPNSTRYRVGSVAATGGVMFEREHAGGTRGSYYVNVDGRIEETSRFRLNRPEDRKRIWQPPDERTRQAAEAALDELGQAPVGSPEAAAAREKLRRIVKGESSEAGTENSARKEPTPAQIAAGNYKKGHIKVHGLDISIENPIGSIRRSKPDAPVQWERKMRDHYGYIRGTEDNTGEHVDVFVAAEPKGDKVFVIDQVIDGKFDEPKVLVGYESEKEARRAYLRNYQRGWKGLGAITALSVPEFKRWLNSGGPTRPLSWKPPEERRSTRRPDPRNDSLLEYISKVRLGETSGLNFDDLVAEGLDPAELRAARGHGINRPFTKRGASLDEMAEHLAEVGFPVLDKNGNYDKNILLDLITKDLRQGTRTMSAWAQNYDEELERLAQKYDFDRDEAEELVDTAIRFDEHADLTDEELNRLEAQLERIAKIEADRQPAEETEPDVPFSVRDRRTADMFGAKPTEPRKSEAPARQRAVQGDLFGGASEIQQMLERVRAEKDRRRNAGQESLETGDPTDLFSQARKQTDIEDKAKPPVAKAGEIREDLVTYEGPAARDDRVQADTRTDVDAKHGASAVPVDVHASGPVQLDIFANAAQPEPAARAARLLARTRHVETGSFKTSLERIRHWEDAAHLIAPLRKSPQEQFLAIVLDEKSQPIAVLRHTVGLVGLSPVDPGIVAGSIVRIPGARRVYFAHNHPSGEIAPSEADFEVTQLLVDALEGTQVEPLGMIIVGPGRKDATFFRPSGYPETSPITRASRRGRSVPQIERRFRKVFDRQSPIIDNSAKAIDAIRKVDEQSGVLLLDFKGRLIGVVPMDEAEMQRLRTGDPSRGAARLLAALEEANASTVIPFGSTASARNVAAFFRHAGVNVAYVIHRQADQWVSDRSGRIGGRFFFSEKKTPRSVALEAHREKIEAAVQKALKGVDGAPKVFVLRRITDVPKHVKDRYPLDSISPARARGIEGMYDWQRGEIYLFSDALTSPGRAAWVLFHELAGHHGVRRAAEMLGIDVNEVRQRVLNNRFVRQLAEEIAAQRGITDPLRAADEALAELAAAVRTGNYDHIQDRYGLKVPPAQRNTIRGLITRLIQAIRRALARRFGVRTQDFSDADVYALLQHAWRAATAQTDTIVKAAPAFSRSEAEGRDLIITHKTTAEKLLHAVRMGGFAVPSLAVTRIDGPLKGFGDIFLVGDERMATPSRQTKVFGADIYSPRYPRVEFKLNNQAVKKIADTLKPYMVKGERFYLGTTTTIDDLTAVDAFKRYVEAKHNLKNGKASYSLIKEEAENLFRESGASEILFKGFTNAGNRRYVPHTLENVVKTLKKDLRGGEAFNYGVGSLRAHFAPQFKTLAQIRKAKGRLVSEEDFKKVKDEVDNEFFELVDALRPYYTYDANRFGFSDTVMAVMADAARMGLPRALAEYGFRDVPQEIQRNISEYLNKLRTLPTEYFEAKILRGVGLNEFRGALVPEGTDQKVLDALDRAGVRWKFYRNGEAPAALRQLADEIEAEYGARVLFSESKGATAFSEAPAPVFYSAVLRAAENAKIQKGDANQWIGTLRNQPGVKQEELDWIGLEDWLKSLGRSATKQEVVDFIRANQIQVQETLKGAPVARSDTRALLARHDNLVVELTAEGFYPNRYDGTPLVMLESADGRDRWELKNREVTNIETGERATARVSRLAMELREIRSLLTEHDLEDDISRDDTRYERFTIAGGQRYRELLLTMPGESRPAMSFEEWADARGIDLSNADDVEALRDSYRRDARHFESGNVFHSSHWNEPNILAHVRFNERTDQEGKRVLFIEEIQSDWHQEGRRKGYSRQTFAAYDAKGSHKGTFDTREDAEKAIEGKPGWFIEPFRVVGVPNAPFKTTWPELAFKRMLRWAAENGFDRIAWTTGEQQAERYDLSKQVDTIGWLAHDDGTFTIDIEKDGRTLATERSLSPERLEEMVGKDVAEKIVEGAKSADTGELKGLDLKVGGEGMRGFYDQILPKVAAKLTKKWGGKVGETYLLATGDAKLLSNDNAQNAAAIGAAPVHSLDITPAMREAALAGLPLFSEAQDPRLARLERLKQIRAMRKAARAGEAHVPMYQGGQVLPLTATAVQIGTGPTARTVPVPKEPIRREHIIKELERQFGVHIYQGRPFKGRMLGFFRPSNFEVRIKHKNDLEVTAHEIFHWLEATYPELGQLYRQKQFGQELRSISYDAKKLDEGFAEFGRLFLTQDSQAQAKAPNFYIAFTAKAQQLGIYEKLAKVQDRMHQWYMQGALGRAMSKQGVKAEPLAQRMSALADVWADRAIAETVDYLHAAKVIERTLTGTIANDAMQSPYKSLRLLAGARNTIESFLNFGTLNWTPKGLEFTGKGLKQVFEPVANHMEETLLYFVGRRAEELAKYGKERLFTPDEIGAMLDAGRLSPKAKEIEQAFNEYQAYVDRLMDFAEASGIVSAETRALWKAMYQNYVPFYRVSETLGTTRLSGPTISNPFKRLFGGTANLNDIWDNMVMNTAIVVHASLRNVAKRQLFNTIEKSPLGQRFAVRIPTETHSVKVAMQQVEQVLRGLVDEAERRALDPSASAAEKAHYAQVHYALDVLTSAQSASGGSSLEAMQEQATFYVGGQPPSIPDKDSVLVDGKRVWYQIADPLLWDMLTDINYHKPISLLEVVFGGFKRTLTRGVTLTPEFQIANLIRDTLNAFTMSRGGQVPFVHVLGAMVDALRRSEDYKLFLANGGGFGNATPVNEGRRVRMKMRRLYQGGRVNIRAILDTPAKVLDFWDRFGQAFELGTRLAEFKLIKKQGLSLREAAFQGREISSDFAMQGRARTMKAAIISWPFFNARLQGLYRIERELFERNGRQSWRGERQLQYAMRGLLGITIPSLILYWWNKDDEDYQELSDEIKQLYYPVKIPNTHDFVLIPKPFETGAIFSTVPEQVWQYLETKNDRRLVEAAKFMITQTFAVDPVPQAVRPMWQWYANKDWRGLPIVPKNLENVEPREQYKWNTSPTLVEIGKRFDVSPIALDHFLRGYFAGTAAYLTMASDSLVTSKRWGEEPASRLSEYPVARRFLREAPYGNTRYQREFWDLYREVDRVANTARKIREEFRQDDLDAYLGDAEKAVLFGLGGAFGAKGFVDQAAQKAREISAAQIRVRRDPQMSGEQKRQELDKLQRELNELFKSVIKQLNTEQLERYRDALEGKRPQANARQMYDMLAPMIEGKPRRQAVAALREAGYADLASLIASLPPTPDKDAIAFFQRILEEP